MIVGNIRFLLVLATIFVVGPSRVLSWQSSMAPNNKIYPSLLSSSRSSSQPSTTSLYFFGNKEQKQDPSVDNVALIEKPVPEEKSSNFEKTTEKYGLEAGLFESFKSKDGGESAKSLLKKYGIAYLATSIPLAIISFTICYVLVDNGVDVQSLLSKIPGIDMSSVGSGAEKASTVAIAYAIHKAASPIRFPPTVLLTPVVANIIGKEPVSDDELEKEE